MTQIKAIVTDIEGTTSSLSFVKDVLFPYARKHIRSFVRLNEKNLKEVLEDVRLEVGEPDLDVEGVLDELVAWIDADKKITPLKTLQGLIWQNGYNDGELKGHIYDDAAEGLKRWKDEGYDLYVYSSGSIAAQKLLFGYTEKGDLTPLFSGYFDTTTGPKVEAQSYKKIASEIGYKADEILFLSDHIPELDAAKDAGFQVLLLDRDGQAGPCSHNRVSDFDAIDLSKEKAA